LTAALRAYAAGLWCAEAAVELLIGHAVWLRRSGFVDRFVIVETDPGLVGQTALAWVDWHGAAGAVQAGRLPCSSSERHILLIAASLAEGVAVEGCRGVRSGCGQQRSGGPRGAGRRRSP
jgi:hypothetical protein